MKKIALFLAIILCLSLCACTTPQNQQEDPTKDDPAKEAQYQAALESLKVFEEARDLEIHLSDPESYYKAMKDSYDLWAGLGDYKDAKEYVSRFTVVDDVLLYEATVDQDVFGQKQLRLSETKLYGYDANKNWVWDIDYGTKFHVLAYTPQNSPCVATRVYDENNRLISIDEYVGDTLECRCTYTYDSSGNLLTETITKRSGQVVVVTYEPDGSWAASDGEFVKNILNEKGQVTGEMRNGLFRYLYLYTYDENGHKVKALRYNVDASWTPTENNKETEIVWSYKNGICTQYESTIFRNGAKKTTITSTYTYENGHMVAEECGDTTKTIYTHIYGTFYWYNAPQT